MALQAAFALNANEIFSTLANMIISQQVFADNLGKNQTLVDQARVDGGLYGDKKLYYATDVLKSNVWGNDSEASNLLALDRPADPKVQSITLDQFRQIRLTVDNYLTKRGFGTEGAFADFNGVMLGWIRDTKKVYDGTLYNTFIGATETSIGKQIKTIDLSTASGHPLYNLSGVEKEQMEAMLIAQGMADLFVEMGDYSKDFNDYQFLRSYAEDGIKVIWNAKYVNKIRKVDTPTIFHRDGLVDKLDENILPARYFGTTIYTTTVSTGEYQHTANLSSYSAETPTTGKPIDSDTGAYTPGVGNANGTIRSLVERDVTVSGTTYHVFPGDEIPAGATVAASSADFGDGEVYIEDANVICKVLVKLPPYMSAFEVGTTFFNPRSLTENHYLTWGYNTLRYLKNYPFITVKKSA